MLTPLEAAVHGAVPQLTLTERRDADVATILCTGELVVQTSPGVRDAVHGAALGRPRRLVVDLVGVTRLDAAGLVAVTAPVMDARRLGIDVAITPPEEPSARRLADLVGVLPLIGAMR